MTKPLLSVLALSALIVPGLAVGLGAAPAYAATTCRGEAATIVGTGTTVTGTAGRDVIVSGKSFNVDAGAGNDLICVISDTPISGVVTVNAGDGDDVVDATMAQTKGQPVDAVLGAGADAFYGGKSGGEVLAGAWDASYNHIDTEADIIDNRAATNSGIEDLTTSGQTGHVNNDRFYGGGDEDEVEWYGDAGPDAVLDGGPRRDILYIEAAGSAYSVDMMAGSATRDGVQVARPTGFEDLAIDAEASTLTQVSVTGTPDDNHVSVYAATARMLLSLGAGDDGASLMSTSTTGASHEVDLGKGDDGLTYAALQQAAIINLKSGRLTAGGVDGQVAGAEGAHLITPKAVLRGTNGRDVLTGTGCEVKINGAKGSDTLEASRYDAESEHSFTCDRGDRAKVLGGRGDDRITGGSGDDILKGGRGNDRIEGRPGRDQLFGQAGNDRLDGGDDRDKLIGGKGRDFGDGGKAKDRCATERKKRCER